MVRIRYQSNENNTLLSSVQTYALANGQIVRAFLMLDPVFKASVQVVDSTEVLYSEQHTSVRAAKTALKAALKSLGVVFNDEVRTKKTEATEEVLEGNLGE